MEGVLLLWGRGWSVPACRRACLALAAVLVDTIAVLLDVPRWDRFRPAVADRWKEKPDPASGMFYDLGSHMLDQVGLCALRMEQGPFPSPAPLIAAVESADAGQGHTCPHFSIAHSCALVPSRRCTSCLGFLSGSRQTCCGSDPTPKWTTALRWVRQNIPAR